MPSLYGTIDTFSTISKTILNLTPPPVIYTTLVALGATDYLNPPGTFKPGPGGAALPGTASFDVYFQNVVTDTSLSSPISNRWYITLTDCNPSSAAQFVSAYGAARASGGTQNITRYFPSELKVGGWIASSSEGCAWRIVKIFNNITPGASNTYVSPVPVVLGSNKHRCLTCAFLDQCNNDACLWGCPLAMGLDQMIRFRGSLNDMRWR